MAKTIGEKELSSMAFAKLDKFGRCFEKQGQCKVFVRRDSHLDMAGGSYGIPNVVFAALYGEFMPDGIRPIRSCGNGRCITHLHYVPAAFAARYNLAMNIYKNTKTEGSCLLWTGYADDEGCSSVVVPKIISPAWSAAILPRRSPRHVVYWLHTGSWPDFAVTIRSTCGNQKCVAFDHLNMVF